MKGIGDVIKSERFILFGIVDSESDLTVAINTFLESGKMGYLEGQKYCKISEKDLQNKKINNSVKIGVFALFDRAYQKTGKVLFTEMADAVRG